jgi:hypothetical protein
MRMEKSVAQDTAGLAHWEASAPPAARERIAEKAGGEGRMAEPMQVQEDDSVDVTVDVGTALLGAYQLILTYDPSAVAVDAVLPPGAGGFPGRPMSDSKTFDSGRTPIVGLHVGGTLPGGIVFVARVRFRPKMGGRHPISVSATGLFTPDGKPIPGKANLSGRTVGGR